MFRSSALGRGSNSMKICVIIPAFNNDTTVGAVVEKARQQVDHVVVIDDGSEDDTAQVSRDAGAHVIEIAKNRGKGNALRVGFRYAVTHDFDASITLDADLQHDPFEIPRFIECYVRTRAKIIIGDRLRDKKEIPRIRYCFNRIGTYTFSWLLGQPIKDSQCGYRLYDRKVMEGIPITKESFEAEADVLLRVGKQGFTIQFVPIRAIYFWDRSHRSYYRPVRDTFRICIIFLMNLFWKDR